MQTYGAVDVQIHNFFISAIVGGELWASRFYRLTPFSLGTNWIWAWVDTRASLNAVKKKKFLTLLRSVAVKALCYKLEGRWGDFF
jgi:hypothetical protein